MQVLKLHPLPIIHTDRQQSCSHLCVTMLESVNLPFGLLRPSKALKPSSTIVQIWRECLANMVVITIAVHHLTRSSSNGPSAHTSTLHLPFPFCPAADPDPVPDPRSYRLGTNTYTPSVSIFRLAMRTPDVASEYGPLVAMGPCSSVLVLGPPPGARWKRVRFIAGLSGGSLRCEGEAGFGLVEMADSVSGCRRGAG